MWRDLIVYTPMYVTFFWTLVLLSSYRQNNRAKHFLGIFMFIAFILYLSHAVFFKEHLRVYPVFDSLYVLSALTVYPLYYWYIKLLTVETRINFRNLWMFAPALVLALATAFIYLKMKPDERLLYVKGFLLHENVAMKESVFIVFQKWVYNGSRIIFATQVVLFLIFGSRLVVRYNKRIENFYSNLESRTIVWVNLLLISFVITSIASIIFNIIGKAVFFENTFLLLIPSLIFSILLFIIGLQGYMQNHTVNDLEFDERQAASSELKKYNNNLLKESLLELFTVRDIYKQPDLKITQISSILQTNRTYISNLINTEFSCTFNDFVNKYRITEAKRLLSEKDSKKFSLDHVAEKSGFGSLSTFIRVFRDSEGITPGKYRDKNSIEK